MALASAAERCINVITHNIDYVNYWIAGCRYCGKTGTWSNTHVKHQEVISIN